MSREVKIPLQTFLNAKYLLELAIIGRFSSEDINLCLLTATEFSVKADSLRRNRSFSEYVKAHPDDKARALENYRKTLQIGGGM